jgi:hydroxymethylpyrimidine pyrophosphatase-like HAD family hydrolase
VRHLYITDLDCTLLSKGALPPGTLRSLRRVIDSGADFTVATARGLCAAVAPLEDALPRLPIIALNGSVVAYSDGSQPVIERLAPETITPVCRLVDEVGAGHCLLATDGRHDIVFVPPRGDEFTDWSIDEAIYFKEHDVVRERSPTDLEWTRIVRIVVCSTMQKTAKLDRLIKLRCPSVSSVTIRSRDKPGFAWLEIGAPTATKAHAVKYLAAQFGYSLNDVVYYGDAASDLEAMTLVGEAVAVANAEADVRLAADRVIEEARTGAVVRDLLKRLSLAPIQGALKLNL